MRGERLPGALSGCTSAGSGRRELDCPLGWQRCGREVQPVILDELPAQGASLLSQVLPCSSSERSYACLKEYPTACKTIEQRETATPKEAIPDYWLKFGFDVVQSVLHAGSFTPNIFLMLGNLVVGILVRKAFGFQTMGS